MPRANRLGGLVAVMLLGCQPTLRENHYQCTPATIEEDCPRGMACLGGLCTFGLADAGRIDARVSAAPDAPIDVFANSNPDTFVNATADAFARDAHALSDAPTLLSEGFICTMNAQCNAGLICVRSPLPLSPWRSSCRATCLADTDCGPNGWCLDGACNRACDPIARDCLGESTCQFGAGSRFICALTVPSPSAVGGACDDSVTAGHCASGLVCDEPGVCRHVCDVGSGVGCSAPSRCIGEVPSVIWRGREVGTCTL